mmetsp:Transcript_24432/g.48674  ORF Transcript_24432/g.48674 Transcript_24432/m.48674 type:complete len:133 (+) Transcript_24432:210-608(+)
MALFVSVGHALFLGEFFQPKRGLGTAAVISGPVVVGADVQKTDCLADDEPPGQQLLFGVKLQHFYSLLLPPGRKCFQVLPLDKFRVWQVLDAVRFKFLLDTRVYPLAAGPPLPPSAGTYGGGSGRQMIASLV